MLINVSKEVYRKCFISDPHPFISDRFIAINAHKCGQIIRLIEEHGDNTIGLIGGIADNVLKSPFSAPFGGFHFNSSRNFMEEAEKFLNYLKEYIAKNNLLKVEITLPPDIYHHSVNTKLVNSFIQNGFNMDVPEITNWIDLTRFNGTFSKREVMKNYRKSLINKLTFHIVTDEKMKQEAYEIIAGNRKLFDRPIYMTYLDLIETGEIFPIDFFIVKDENETNVGSAIFYRGHPQIIHGTFWADTESGRPLRTMDFLAYNIFNYYKELGFSYIDLGISSVAGVANEGLMQFKEIHDCVSSLRFTFSWVI
jgi:hypothetical protein